MGRREAHFFGLSLESLPPQTYDPSGLRRKEVNWGKPSKDLFYCPWLPFFFLSLGVPDHPHLLQADPLWIHTGVWRGARQAHSTPLLHFQVLGSLITDHACKQQRSCWLRRLGHAEVAPRVSHSVDAVRKYRMGTTLGRRAFYWLAVWRCSPPWWEA